MSDMVLSMGLLLLKPEELLSLRKTVYFKEIKKIKRGKIYRVLKLAWTCYTLKLKSFSQIDYGTSSMQDIHTIPSPVYTVNLQKFTHSIKQFVRCSGRPQVQIIHRKSKGSRGNTVSRVFLIAVEETVEHTGDLQLMQSQSNESLADAVTFISNTTKLNKWKSWSIET